MRLYDPHQHRAHILQYGHDPAVVCLGYMAWTLSMLGYPDQALQKSNEALPLAREIGYAPSLAYALYFASFVHNWRGEWSSALLRAQETVSFATQRELPFWLGLATFALGWTRAGQGKYEDGIAQMRQGVAIYQATGARLGLSQILTALAEAHRKVGQYKEGFTVLAEADAHIETSGEYHCAAEVVRLKGELTLVQSKVQSLAPSAQAKQKAQGKRHEAKLRSPRSLASSASAEAGAETYFLQALDMARQQSAKSLELRAAMSLAQLWRQQGKIREAHNLLADIYGWFTEGFDTADLQEAKALLQELA
ncbi:MAG: hypothetical protein HY268_00175 [Deltaproteobacteria bacterium]|nr:hypothetical protein [Deltaproteobacteria bacterium]